MNKYYGEETEKALSLYNFSGYSMPKELIDAGLTVKKAACLTNSELGYLSKEKFRLIDEAIEYFLGLDADALKIWYPLDPFQGGAGTAFNMNLNEAITAKCAEIDASINIDPLNDVNMHQSTNDVVPTALKLMMLKMFVEIENRLTVFQNVLQEKERAYSKILKTGRTQLQDAAVLTAGEEFSTWAHSIARDRWRVFKARERIKEVNLGGTAIGTGTGAPKKYIFKVSQNLKKLVNLPITRAEQLVENTSNYDSIAEAMGIIKVSALNIRRICSDLRLLSSGPNTGFAEYRLPAVVKGSTIMPDKVNPVMLEAGYQLAQRIITNDILIAQLCSDSELQLNAFFPMIAYTVWESLNTLSNLLPALGSYIAKIEINEKACNDGAAKSHSKLAAVLPLLPYSKLETMIKKAKEKNQNIEDYLAESGIFEKADLDKIFSFENLTALGYDEDLYQELKQKYRDKL